MKSVSIIILSIMLITSGCHAQNEAATANSESIQQQTEQTMDKQSEESMKIALAFMDAMGKGDMESMISLMHEDMVWHNEGDKSMPWIGPWKGKKVILEEFLPVFGANFQTSKWETEDSMSSGNTAAFFGRMAGTLTKSNQSTNEFTFALRVKVKDGQVILWNWFEDSYDVSRAYH
ncbi:MAG: nuclear transport factor 2 family protein, partial [Bacteroidota bacterium]